MTITVPPGVREQMDQVTEQVNWSAVAAEAFRRKVAEIKNRRTRTMTKEMVLKRLKAAGEADPKGFEAGRKCGRKWAEEKALPRYLRNIANDVEDAFIRDDPEWTLRQCVKLGALITDDQSSALDFWQDAIGKDGESLADYEDFARGFVAGAREVWEEVKDAL
jgi:hypothetical protein